MEEPSSEQRQNKAAGKPSFERGVIVGALFAAVISLPPEEWKPALFFFMLPVFAFALWWFFSDYTPKIAGWHIRWRRWIVSTTGILAVAGLLSNIPREVVYQNVYNSISPSGERRIAEKLKVLPEFPLHVIYLTPDENTLQLVAQLARIVGRGEVEYASVGMMTSEVQKGVSVEIWGPKDPAFRELAEQIGKEIGKEWSIHEYDSTERRMLTIVLGVP